MMQFGQKIEYSGFTGFFPPGKCGDTENRQLTSQNMASDKHDTPSYLINKWDRLSEFPELPRHCC